MKQLQHIISRITLAIMGEGRGVGLLLCICGAIAPQMLWAEQTEVSTYSELKSAITDGATSIKVTADLTSWSSVTFQDKTLEIDFDGHKVSGISPSSYMFTLRSSNICIKNLGTTSCSDFCELSNSTMTISGCTITDSEDFCFSSIKDSQLNINSCTISGGNSSCLIQGVRLVTLSGTCEFTNSYYRPIFTSDVLQVKIQGGYKLYNLYNLYTTGYYYSEEKDVDVTQHPNKWGSHLILKTNSNACANGAHTMETKGISSTCTTAGNGYYHCTTCNVDYTDAQGDWLYAYGHAIPILGHDIDKETGKCSRCDAEYQMLKEGMNTNLTFEAVTNKVSSPSSPVYSDFTTVYCFKAPATGQLTIKCGEDDYCDLIGLFDARFDLIGSECSVERWCTSITKPVVEGNVYYIGMRAYSPNTQLTGRSLIISGTWPKGVTITDGEAYASVYETVNNITYKRTVSEDEVGKWEALYVPFQMGYDDWNSDFDVATIVNVHEYSDANGAVVNTVLEARYVTNGYKLKANTPYLIRPKTAGEKTITLTNTTIENTNSASIVCQSVERKYTYAGTYKPKQGLQSAGCYFITDGKLKKATDDETTLKAQRWYMTIENLRGQVINGSDASDANAINICIITDDDHTKTLTKTEAVAATCTKAGNTAYYHCSECGTYFSNAAGTMAIAENSWVIPATGQHSYVNGTCTQCGIPARPATVSIAEDGYYLLSTAADLAWFRDFVNFRMTDGENTTYPYVASNARLTADIDMSSICSSTTQSWEPIGKPSAYLGTFDGNNHELKNIYINVQHDKYGFIGQLGKKGEATPACVKNLTISGSITSTSNYVGAIAATAQNAEITNCHNKANIKCYELNGGIVGYHDAGSLSITKSSNSGNIETTNDYVGGIVGKSYGSSLTFEECNNSGSITTTSDYSGGLAGYINGTATIAKSCNTGSVTGESYVGGLVGHANDTSNSSSLTNCYNTGTVKSTTTHSYAYIGGIFGYAYNYTVNNVFSAAPVIRESGVYYYGAFAGYYSSSTFNNCYYDNEKADCGFQVYNYIQTPSGNNGGKTTAEFASGYMAYLLNGNTSDGTLVWYQVIGGDATPTLEQDQYCIVKKNSSNVYYNDKETLESLELVDGTAYSINRERTATSLTYTRTFGGTNWTTWYVPFELTLTSEICAKYDFSRINNVHQYEDEDGDVDETIVESFRQNSGVTLKANYPYLVRAKSDADKEMTLNLNDATVKAAKANSIFCQSIDYKYTFTGTYSAMGNGEDESAEYSLFDDNADGWKNFQTLKPQRHYLTITSRDGSSMAKAPRRIMLKVVGEENATGIVTLYDNTSAAGNDGKYLENGKIVIVRNGKKYNTNGQVIK